MTQCEIRLIPGPVVRKVYNTGNVDLSQHQVNCPLAHIELEMAPNLSDPETSRLEFTAYCEAEEPRRADHEDVGQA